MRAAIQYLNKNMSRLAALHGLKVLDSGSEKFYDDITQLTADICEAPVCLISLVEQDRQWFKSEVGIGVEETVIDQSICAHALKQDTYLEVRDTHLDPRTVGNTLCQGDTPFRFYAGAILRTMEGWPLGTLCVLDYKPRELTDIQRRILNAHAISVTRHMELTRVLMDRRDQGAVSLNPASHSPEALKRISDTREGFESLTPREIEVLKLIAGQSVSLTSKEIAKELDISFRTVHHHRANLMSKINVASVAELIKATIKADLFK